MKADPTEATNLIGQASHAPAAARLRAHLRGRHGPAGPEFALPNTGAETGRLVPGRVSESTPTAPP